MGEALHRKYWAFLAPFSVFLSVLNTYGYWGSFHVNAFSFLTINELFLGSIHALIWVLAITLIGAFLGVQIHACEKRQEGSNPSRAKIISRGMDLGGFAFAGLAGVAFAIDHPFKWILMAPFLAPIVSKKIVDAGLLDELVGDHITRVLLAFMLTLMAFYAFGKGRIDAYNVRESLHAQVISDGSCTKRFVGKAGEFMFFYEPKTGGVTYQPISKLDIMTLVQQKNGKCGGS